MEDGLIDYTDMLTFCMCCRFLARYPEYPALFDTIEICLDEVAKDLSETYFYK